MENTLTRDQVLEALQQLQDKVPGYDLAAAGRIRDIMVKESSVYLTIVLADNNDERKASYQQDVEQTLRELGAERVNIRFRLPTEAEAGSPSTQQTRASSSGSPASILLSDTVFIAIASGKGGVGKSTVTVNLAVALARLGKRVGIIDADIYGFSVPDMMGIEERPVMEGNLMVPVRQFGVSVMSMGFFVEENAPIIWRGPMLGKMLRHFFSEVAWGELDYLLLDLPPGTGDVALDVHQMIPQSKEIVVTTPHSAAAKVAARAGYMAIDTQHDILGVIENMAYYTDKTGARDYLFGSGGGERLAQELDTELLAQIPIGAGVNDLEQSAASPSVYRQDSASGQLYIDVARRVVSRLEQ